MALLRISHQIIPHQFVLFSIFSCANRHYAYHSVIHCVAPLIFLYSIINSNTFLVNHGRNPQSLLDTLFCYDIIEDTDDSPILYEKETYYVGYHSRYCAP